MTTNKMIIEVDNQRIRHPEFSQAEIDMLCIVLRETSRVLIPIDQVSQATLFGVPGQISHG
jgi:hypothetical protein